MRATDLNSAPKARGLRETEEWARRDSNTRATSYEPAALPLSYRPSNGDCGFRALEPARLAERPKVRAQEHAQHCAMDDEKAAPRPSAGSYAFAVLPTLALTLGIPFANHVEPRILGLPFLLAYIVIWILATPLFMFAAFKAMRAGE